MYLKKRLGASFQYNIFQIQVIRFLISNFYTDKIDERYSKNRQKAKEEYEKEIKPMLEEFMEKYGDQWRRLGEDE